MLANVCLLLGIIGIAFVAKADEQSLVPMAYHLDLNLTYLDKLQNYNAEQSRPRINSMAQERSRSLGLTRMRAELKWEMPQDSRLVLVLRPDALIQQNEDPDQTEGYEIDSRAGNPYRGSPRIQFLDAYQVTKIVGDSLDFGFGVWESIIGSHMSYASPLKFGLLVNMMSKFSAVRASWRSFSFTPKTAQDLPPSGWLLDLYVTKGDGDRSEVRGYRSKTFDRAPSSDDPHYGFAFGLMRLDADFNRFGIVAGLIDSDYSMVDDSSGREVTLKGDRGEIYAQLYDEIFFRLPVFSTKVSLDARYAKEKWQGDELDLDSRTQSSLSLTGSTEPLPGHWLVFGYHMGKSDLDNGVSQSGYQLDFGYVGKIAQTLDLTLMITDEHRDLKDGSGTRGAFEDAKEDASLLRRFAIDFHYDLGQTR